MTTNQNQKKGFAMPLPFLAGIAAGALAVVAWNKRDELKKYASKGLDKGKDIADKFYEKGLGVMQAANESMDEKIKKPRRKRRTPEQMAEARAAEAAAKKGKKKRKPRAKKVVEPTPQPVIAPENA